MTTCSCQTTVPCGVCEACKNPFGPSYTVAGSDGTRVTIYTTTRTDSTGPFFIPAPRRTGQARAELIFKSLG